ITVTPEGSTFRGLMPSYECRSSSKQFCCNENLCNSLAYPPLPALTSLKCAVGRCSNFRGICVDDSDLVTVLSSATESCSVSQDGSASLIELFTNKVSLVVRQLLTILFSINN
ncbi:unnamed protein product, partial [Rotaria sp. Silwood2]